MALCKLSRFGNDEPVWVNPHQVLFVEGTDRMGTRIHLSLLDRDGAPLVLQVNAKAADVVTQLDRYGATS